MPAVLISQATQTPNLEQILDKHFEAMGGLDKLNSIKTARITLKVSDLGMDIKMVTETKRPSSFRIEMEVMGQKMPVIVNEEGGWRQDQRGLARLEGRDLSMSRIMAEFGRSPFIDYKARGHKLEYQGEADHNGAKAYKIGLATKEGYKNIVSIDTKSYLPVKFESINESGSVDNIILFSDYKMVDGINIAHTIEVSNPLSSGPNMKMVTEKFEINPSIDDSRFQPPK
jgi:outer membrane lipoprotein-sorting protein